MAKKLGGVNKFRSALAGMPITFRRLESEYYVHNGVDYVAWTVLDVKFANATFTGTDIFASGTVVHELAHVWDTRQAPIFSLSSEMARQTESFRYVCSPVWSLNCTYQYDPNGPEAPPTGYGETGQREDFADSFAIYVYPSYKGVPSLDLFPIRKKYIEALVNGN